MAFLLWILAVLIGIWGVVTLIRGQVLLGIPAAALLWRRHGNTTTTQLTRTLERFREEAEFLDAMVEPLSRAGWFRAADAARRKTGPRLHLGWLALRDCLALRPRDAAAKASLIREFTRGRMAR